MIRLIAFMRNGSYKITSYDLTNRYEPEKTLLLEKFNPAKPVSAVYVDGDSKQYMVKRFMIETSTADKEFGFISETIGSRLVVATTSETPEVEVEEVKGKDKGKTSEVINLEDIIDVKGWKALGNKLSQFKVTKVNLVQEEDAGPDESGGDDEAHRGDRNRKRFSVAKKKSSRSKSGTTRTNGSRTESKQTSSKKRQSQTSKPSKKQVKSQKSKPSSKASSGKVSKVSQKKKVKKR